MSSFAHLHVHTEYSLLDGMSRIPNLVAHAKELGQTALGITDHGTMYGVVDFYRACKEAGIKPIIGVESYLAPRRMTDRDSKLDKDYSHILLIAHNAAGYRNLLKIASVSQLEGYYYKPRIDREFLAGHSEGLICTTGCLAAEIPQLLLQGREKDAKELLGWYWDLFGPDRFFVELQEHDIPELHQVNKMLFELAPYASVPFLATNDVHYVRREDANPHDVLLCIGTGSRVNEQNRMRFSDASYYLRSSEEMEAIFGHVEGALSNSLKIVEMVDFDMDEYYRLNDDTGKYKLPIFPVPEGFDAQTYLRERCYQGLIWRYGDRHNSAEVVERIEYELGVIHDMGFDNYFLIVWDLCEFAREQDIWWNVRGSGAGSVVAYALGITNIDPLRNALLFERFLNPGRRSMPDIDIDYPDDRRGEMIEYCVHKYGADKVAHIITFGTLGARAAVRDVGRTLEIPLEEVDQLARTIPNVPGKPVTLQQMIEDGENVEYREFHNLYQDSSRPYLQNLVDTAMQLEGISRHASTHAAGVLVSDVPLVEYIPLHRPTKGEGEEGVGVVSQWPMAVVESIGLLKVDFLGLRTLTIMRRASELIERYHGVRFNLDNIPYRHEEGRDEDNARLDKAFRLLWRGETSGVFQVEGQGMTRMLTEMKPTKFEHIIAAISLFRPGPIEYIPQYIRRMHGEEDVIFHHPLLEPILGETYAICVYQEQIMQIAGQLFGYDLGEADLMRRAVSKKKEKDLLKHRAIFRKNGPARGVDEETADKIFDDIEFFARYGFNKSHAADYAVLTMQTAYLKTHYPHEYMTALLSIERGDSGKVREYINECRRMNIPVLPPHVNNSHNDFTIEDAPNERRAIRYGLSAVKNVGEGAVEAIVQGRAAQPFRDVADMAQRVDLRSVGKRALECLIKVGALEGMADSRPQLLESLDRIVGFSSRVHQAAEVGQMSLFGESTGVELAQNAEGLLVTEIKEQVGSRELRQWEQELVGMYVSDHPLQALFDEIGRVVTKYSNEISEADQDKSVTMAGTVMSVRPTVSKSGKSMAYVQLEDLYGPIEILVWPNTWKESKEIWQQGRVLLVRGKLDIKGREPRLLCEQASTDFSVTLSADGPPPPPRLMPDLPTLDWSQVPEPPPPGYDDHYPYGVVADEPPPFPDDPLPPPDPAPLRSAPAEARPANGQSAAPANGHAHLEPSAAPAPTPRPDSPARPASPLKPASPTKPAEQAPARHLSITFRRSGDDEKDKRRLQKLHGILIERPGQDSFTVHLTGDGKIITVEFPNERTSYEAVAEAVCAFLGNPDAISVLNADSRGE